MITRFMLIIVQYCVLFLVVEPFIQNCNSDNIKTHDREHLTALISPIWMQLNIVRVCVNE